MEKQTWSAIAINSAICLPSSQWSIRAMLYCFTFNSGKHIWYSETASLDARVLCASIPTGIVRNRRM